ncbi:MAG: hypothetical protein M3548_03490 [Actinomycetota bacterium]|nr:hypothetical protein [Actinomycetota bacterium]
MNTSPALGGPLGFLADAASKAADAITRGVPGAGGQFVVNHDNILAAANIIQIQVDTLEDLFLAKSFDLLVEAPGEDIVSVRIANEWNDRLVNADDSYAARVTEYVTSLRKLITQLRDSAANYGFSEDEIAAAFRENRG